MAFKAKQTPTHEGSPGSEIVRRFRAHPAIFIGTVVILALTIVSFVLVPAFVPEAGRGQNADLTFGSYDKVPITYVPGNYFAQYQATLAQRYQNSMDPNNYMDMSFQIWQQAFNAAAVHTAILQELKTSDYSVPSETVDKQVAMLFQENGHFNAAQYQRLSNNDQLALWRQTRDDIAKRLYVADVTGLQKNTAEADFIAQMASLQRSFDMAVFPVDDYPDSEVLAYVNENPNLFRSIHLSKITINSGEREARQILASVKDGTSSFEDAARTHSQDSYAEKGGDMGIKLDYELVTDIPDEETREKVIALGKGEFSELIKLDTGWAFFRAEDAVQPANTAEEAMLVKARSYLRDFERGRMEDWAVAQAQDFIALARESGFDKALEQRGMEKRGFGPVPLNYGNVDLFTTLGSFGIQQLSNASTNENFWKIAFSTPLNSSSEPFVQDSNVLVLYPNQETAAEASSIEGIASTYSEYWLSYMTELSMQSYFLESEKMDNRFFATYFRYFMPTGN
jgi:parvulin-like peptidyl-prolyl isomerase